MPAQTAYLLTSMLEGVVQNGTGRTVKALNRPVAGKTGTTNDQHDAWFMGYTPDLLAGVWVGYDDQRSLGASGTGGHVAAPVWLAFMKEATANTSVSDFTMPNGIACVHVDPETGLRARADNVQAYLECFKRGTEPRTFTPIWKYDPELGTETLVTDETTDPVNVRDTPPPAPPIRRQIFQ
jgi:penicillin-binding protein 1A